MIVSAADKNNSGDAHISQQAGSTNGIQPDTRSGTTVAAVKVANLKQAAKKAGCDLRLHLKEEGHEHLPPTAPTPEYETNPPTSGNHVEPPYQQADGAYKEMPKEIDIVHSLEHGRLEIQYSPSLPESAQLELIGLYDTMYGAACSSRTKTCPTRWRRRPGATCSAATNTRGDHARRDPRLRQADLGQGPRANRGLPLHRADPGRTDRRLSAGRPVGGEEAARVEAGREPGVGGGVGDELGAVPGQLAIGEAALELLEPVAARDAAAEVERLAQLGRRARPAEATTFFIGESRRCESALPLR